MQAPMTPAQHFTAGAQPQDRPLQTSIQQGTSPDFGGHPAGPAAPAGYPAAQAGPVQKPAGIQPNQASVPGTSQRA